MASKESVKDLEKIVWQSPEGLDEHTRYTLISRDRKVGENGAVINAQTVTVKPNSAGQYVISKNHPDFAELKAKMDRLAKRENMWQIDPALEGVLDPKAIKKAPATENEKLLETRLSDAQKKIEELEKMLKK
jgi:hypothetical protein